jgi:hypothetical protein
MISSSIARVSVAILASALLTFAAIFDWPLLTLLSSTPYDRAVESYCYVDHWRSDPTLAARVLSLSIFLLSPIAAAVFAAFAVARARVWSGALAGGTSQLVAYVTISIWHASFCNSWGVNVEDLAFLSILIVVLTALGAAAAWLALRWRPNTSLERTREG